MSGLSKINNLYWSYDASADVILVTTDPARPCYGEELENFENLVLLLRDMETDKVCGIRVFGARQHLSDLRLQIDERKKAIIRLRVRGRKQATRNEEPSFDRDDYITALNEAGELLGKLPRGEALFAKAF